MNAQAIRRIAAIALENLEVKPVGQQIAVYEDLSQLLPTKEERTKADRIAFTLKEATALQTEFTADLFRAEKGAGR